MSEEKQVVTTDSKTVVGLDGKPVEKPATINDEKSQAAREQLKGLRDEIIEKMNEGDHGLKVSDILIVASIEDKKGTRGGVSTIKGDDITISGMAGYMAEVSKSDVKKRIDAIARIKLKTLINNDKTAKLPMSQLVAQAQQEAAQEIYTSPKTVDE